MPTKRYKVIHRNCKAEIITASAVRKNQTQGRINFIDDSSNVVAGFPDKDTTYILLPENEEDPPRGGMA